MNYTTIFSVAARSAEVHDAIQRYIRHECPVIEQRIKRRALITAIALLEFILIAIDWAQGHLERMPEYRLQFQIAKIRVYRFFVRLAIRLETARLAFAPKVTAALDTVFALN